MPSFELGVVIVLIAGAFLALGLWHLTESRRVVTHCIAAIDRDEVTVLANECMRVFASSFDERLSLDDWGGSIEALERVVNRPRAEAIKKVFATEEVYWRFVLVIGSFMGELLRRHAAAEWIEEEAGLAIQIGSGEDALVLHPFEAVLTHIFTGNPGDLRRYLEAAAGTSGGELAAA